MVEIPLTQGKIALVDDRDAALVRSYGSWHAARRGRRWYAASSEPGNRAHRVLMHRLIMGAERGLDIDHINHNGLDNRRENIRVSTHSTNDANVPKRAGTSSQYKGVTWDAWAGRWKAGIKVNYRSIHLGRFDDEKDAARAYDAAALEHFGEFARLNFPVRTG